MRGVSSPLRKRSARIGSVDRLLIGLANHDYITFHGRAGSMTPPQIVQRRFHRNRPTSHAIMLQGTVPVRLCGCVSWRSTELILSEAEGIPLLHWVALKRKGFRFSIVVCQR